MTKFHFIYQIINSIVLCENQILDTCTSKKKDKKIDSLKKDSFKYEKADLITIFYYLFEMGALKRLSLQKNIQALEDQISSEETSFKNPQSYFKKIKKVMYEVFCVELQRVIEKCEGGYGLGFKIDGKLRSFEYIELLKKRMLNLVSE